MPQTKANFLFLSPQQKQLLPRKVPLVRVFKTRALLSSAPAGLSQASHSYERSLFPAGTTTRLGSAPASVSFDGQRRQLLKRLPVSVRHF